MDDAIQKFGENVRRARHERGWTQEDLSAKTGLAVVQISRIERGKREIRLTTLIRLLDAFDLEADALLQGVLSRSAPESGEPSGRKSRRPRSPQPGS